MMCKQGSARAILTGVLAGKLERYLGAIAKRSDAPPIAPLEFLAVSLAHAQLGIVEAWLSDACCDAPTTARVLHATTRAGVAAVFAQSR